MGFHKRLSRLTLFKVSLLKSKTHIYNLEIIKSKMTDSTKQFKKINALARHKTNEIIKKAREESNKQTKQQKLI
jgi:hypothetical protein